MSKDEPQTEEEMVQFVHDSIREGFNPTKESKQRSRASFLSTYDEATAQHLKEAEDCGAEIGDMKLTVEFRFNKELGTWEISHLQERFPMDLPHPIKRLYGVYTVDDKFWEGKHGEDDEQ